MQSLHGVFVRGTPFGMEQGLRTGNPDLIPTVIKASTVQVEQLICVDKCMHVVWTDAYLVNEMSSLSLFVDVSFRLAISLA